MLSQFLQPIIQEEQSHSKDDNRFYKVFHSTVQAYIDQYDLQSKIDELGEEGDVESVLPEFLTRTSHKIDSRRRVDIQGKIQKYIDHSISSTINLPEDVQPELISDIYIHWQNNTKRALQYIEMEVDFNTKYER